jgi:hypothetical protein
MSERVGIRRCLLGWLGRLAYGELQERLHRLLRQMRGKVEEAVLGGSTHVRQPLGRHTIG